MECFEVEERLSEYLDRTLPSEAMAQVAEHLHACSACSALLEEMRSVLVACKAYPALEPDVELIEKILLRTSGRPRTRSFRELLQQYFLRPMLTPRFAVGAALAVLFLIFARSLLLPHVTSFQALLSPREWVRQMDRGVQAVYSEGLRAYQAKIDWQQSATNFKDSVFHKLGLFMEQLDVPVEGKQKPQEQKAPQREPKGTSEKSSSLRTPVARGLVSVLLKGVQS
jgi:hypothetical protein